MTDRLVRRIAREGPIPFRDWMEAALYDSDEGYYMRGGRKTGTGRDADFATPPTLHPFFGVAVAREMRDAPGRVVEYGGGEGDLARHAVAELRRLALDPEWRHVERSPVHRARQLGTDAAITPGASGKTSEEPPTPADWGVFCEVLDAIPGEVFDAAGRLCRIAWVGKRFTWESEPARTDSHAAAAFLEQAAKRHGLRHVLVIDYPGPATAPRAYRQHVHADVLDDPGTVDVTLPVDFSLVHQTMASAGFRVARDETLESFMLRHGILEELNSIQRGTEDGASSYLRLRQLLLPTGLGGAFRVVRYERM